MKLSRYNIFSMFKLFESLLEVDSELFQLLKYMETSSPIAASLVKIITNRKDLKLSQNYLRPAESNDELNFLNDGQGKRAKEAGEDPFSKKGNIAKIGRIVRQILISNGENISDADIEKFVNLYKATWNKKYAKSDEKMRFVSGEDIRFWYNEKNYNKGGGTLNNSCMRYETTQDFLDIYALNPESCRLLIYVDDNNDLVARAIVWKLETPVNGSNIYLDRIYYTHDHMQRTMYDFAAEKLGIDLGGQKFVNSHWNGNGGTFKVKLQKTIFKKYPYMDSIYYLYPKDSILSNYSGLNGPYVKVRNTSGRPERMNGFVISYYAKDIVRERDCEFIERRDAAGIYTIQDWIPRDQLVYAEGNGTYGFKEEITYLDLYKQNYLKNSLVETEWGLIPKNNLYDVYKIEGRRVENNGKYPGILLQKGEGLYACADVYDYGEIYLRKEDCVPPIIEGDYWTPKIQNLRRRSNYIDFYKVGNSTTELNGIKIRTLTGQQNLDTLKSVPKRYEIVDGDMIVKEFIRLISIDGSYYILGIKLDSGYYPFGLYYRDELFCDKAIVDYFNLEVIETRWMGINKFQQILYRGMLYKEIQDINNKIDGSNTLVSMFSSADNYLKNNYNDYNNLQMKFELGGIVSIKEWVINKFTEVMHDSSYYGYDFEGFLKLESTSNNIRAFYRNSNYGNYRVSPKGKETSVEEWKEALQRYRKGIAVYILVSIINGNKDSNSPFNSLMEYRGNDLRFKDQEIQDLKSDREFLRHLCYSEVSGDFGRYIVKIIETFSKYRDIISQECYTDGSNGRDGIIWVFNRFWEKHENILKQEQEKSKETNELENPSID